ncbi:MAG: peptidase S41, partial [Gammaproteobacteria bacterium]
MNVCLFLLLFLLSLTTSIGFAAEQADTSPVDETPMEQGTQRGQLPLDELRVFAEAFDRISRAYVEDVDDKALLEKAIKGLLSELDPHSAFLDAESFDDLQESTTGNYGGLGIEIGRQDGV